MDTDQISQSPVRVTDLNFLGKMFGIFAMQFRGRSAELSF